MEPSTILPWISLFIAGSTAAGLLYNWFGSSGTKALSEVGAVKRSVADTAKAAEDAVSDLKERLEREEKIRDAAIVARFQLVESKVLVIEGKLEQLPSRDATHGLEIAMERLSGKIEVLEERLKPVDLLSRRLQDILINKAEGK